MSQIQVGALVASPTLQIITICVGVLNIVWPCLMIKYLMEFYYKRRHPLLLKRYTRITIISTVGCIIHSIGITWSILSMTEYLSSVAIIPPFLVVPGIIMAFGGLSIRFWLIRFDTKLAQIGLTKQWQILINSNHSKVGENSWYVKYKSSLGNENFLIKWIFIVLSLIGIGTISLIMNAYVSVFVSVSVSVFVCVFVCLCVCVCVGCCLNFVITTFVSFLLFVKKPKAKSL